MNPSTLRRSAATTVLLAALAAGASGAQAATLVASYGFNNTLAASQAGVPALVSIDPLGLNGFETASVFGVQRTVFRWSGDGASSANNAGLLLNATGLVNYSSYSVAMTFEFASQAAYGGGWRRILDTEGRQSDNGFYVAPQNVLEAVQGSPVADGSTLFTTPGFHNVLFTVAPSGNRQLVSAWLDGQLEFSVTADVFSLDNANNPGHLLQFFVDNTAAGAQQEYANGRIAALALYDGVITPSAVPEPSQAALLLAGAAALALGARLGRPARSAT